MKNDHFRLMLKDAPYAYALHEVMLDDQGKPYDYRYIEVNEAFRQLTGIETTDIAGKTVTELLPGIRSGSFDWVEHYGKVALEGGHETFEQYSEPLGKWYRVLVHSAKKHFFSTIFTDITLEKEFETYKKRLQLAQSFTGTGAWEYDINNQTLFWSAECEKLFGLKEGAFEGTFNDFLKRVHPDDRQYVVEVNMPITELKEGIPLHYEHRIITDDGEERWVRESAGVVYDETGRPAKIIGFVTDITARKNNEEKLESEEKLRHIINNIDGAFWLMSANREEVLYLSPGFEQILGRPIESIRGDMEAYIKTIIEEDREDGINAYTEFLKTGKYDLEYRIKRPDESIRWVHSKAFPVKNEQGKVIRYAGIITDITEQKNAEAEAQKLQDSYKEELEFRQFLFNSNKDGLVIVNNDHKVVDANTEFLRMLGYSIDEIKHLHTWDFDAITTEEDIRTGIDTTIAVDTTFESKHKKKDGSVYNVEISARSFYWQGERLVVCTCRNISERKRMEHETLAARRLAEANQRRFEQIAEHTGEFIWEVDKDGIYTYANLAIEKILGYKPEELVGKKKWYDLLSENNKTKTIEEVSKTIENKEPIRNLENVMISKSVQEVHVITNGIPVLDAEGELIGYRGSDRDITEQIKAEARLKDSEAKYRMLFNANKDSISIFYINDDGLPSNFVEMNDAGAAIIGFTKDELLKINISEIEIPASPEEAKQNMKAIIEKGEANFETKARKKNGEVIDVEVKAVLINYNERPAILNISRDITERKRVERALKESEEKFRRLTYNLHAGIVVHDTDTKITFFNREASNLLGLAAEQMSGRDAEHPEWYFLNDQGNKIEADEYPVNVVFSSKKALLNKTFGIVHQGKNDVKWVLVNAYPEHDQDGRINQVVVTFINITELKEAKEKISESELFANAIIETTPALLYIYDLDKGENVWANEHHKRFFAGMAAENKPLKRDDILELTHPNDFEKLSEVVNNLVNDPQTDKTEAEIRIKHKGIWRWFNVLISVFKRDTQGNVTQILGALIDIDDSKKAKEELLIAKEKAEAANRLKTAFIDNISHEIRTPLNGIMGFGQLIAQSDLTREERSNYFKVLQKSTERLIQTVTDFMDISKIASGNMKVNTREFMLRGVLEDQLERFTKVCKPKNVSVKLELPGSHANLLLTSDDELLRKVLGHLLANAAKFTERGSISFGYTVKEQHLEFFVKDQGKGIAADRLDTIYGAFEQEDPEMTRGHEGSGLGLAITKGIVDLLGGTVGVQSEKNKGSEFYFTIPCQDIKIIEEPGLPMKQVTQTIQNPLILIAEDDDSNYIFIEIVLKKAGYNILRAKNGKQAVEICESNPDISLVLMDIKMPVMDGMEATRLIKQFRGDLPVVAITAYLKSGEEHLIKDAGCEEFCFKPFGKDDLLAVVSKYVGKPKS